ncbi:MAG: hypothetical protein ACRCTI_19600 [Beijerinckiaceae bacterium]
MPTGSTDTLDQIVADAYRVFARYDPGGSLVVCNCPVCMTKEIEAQLIRTPLRQISSDTLAEYTNSAHGWDDGKIADDTRYFLPRYLELIAADDPPDNMGLDICLRRIAPSNWRTAWPKPEVDVLERFFDALVKANAQKLELGEWPIGWLLFDDVKDALTCAATAGADMSRVLAAWRAAADPGAALHMAHLRRSAKFVDGGWRFHSAYLEDLPEIAAMIGAFLMEGEISARIEAAFFTVEDSRLQKILSESLFT